MNNSFDVQLMNPNPSSRKTKEGPQYFVKFEVEKEFHDYLMEAKTAGMILAARMQVSEDGQFIEEQKQDDQKKQKQKRGLSYDAAMLCKEPMFWAFLQSTYHIYNDEIKGNIIFDEYESAGFIKYYCEIESRSELNNNALAAHRFKELHGKYSEWVASQNASGKSY